MKLPKIKRTYIVTVNYKSGKTVKFEAVKFTVSNGLSEVNWEAHSVNNSPLGFGLDHVESLWVTGRKWRLVFE